MKIPKFHSKPIRLRRLLYSIFTFVMTAWLTIFVNLVLLILLLLQYQQDFPAYIDGEEIIEELTLTDHGYELSDTMQRHLTAYDQWAMLLDGTGKVVWSYAKPAELKDVYSLTDVARMCRWYLEGYPVYLRLWDDRIMVSGIPKNAMWKYNIQMPVPWINYVKKIWYWLLLFDFLWILVLAAFFTRRWSKGRERARIEWIAGISHDIRTPLSVVLGYAAALEESGSLGEDERQQAAAIKHQSLIMKELIEDLNLTSELEYSMQALRKEPVCPAAMLREVAAAFLDDTGEGRLEIEMDLDGKAEEIVLMADRKLLVRALRNLFQNSLRHSKQEEETVIRLGIRTEKYVCRILFSDNGTGYPEETLRQLNGKKRKQPPQNIRGLGIVCKIVRAHGGKILFGNGEEGGSFCEMRFVIRRGAWFFPT